MNFVLRSAEVRGVAHAGHPPRRISSIDAEQPIHDVATMRAIVRRAMTLERTSSFLTSFFAGAALLMAMLGVYGMVSYSVRQRYRRDRDTDGAGRHAARDSLPHRRDGAEDGGATACGRRHRGARRLVLSRPRLQDRGRLRRLPSFPPPRSWPSWRSWRRSCRRGAPPGCHRWWRSAMSPIRSGRQDGRKCGRPSETCRPESSAPWCRSAR